MELSQYIEKNFMPLSLQSLIVETGELYVVGGVVRDWLISRTLPEEVDFLVIGMKREELADILRGYGSAVYVGSAFGVFKFTFRGMTSDVVLPDFRGSGHGLYADLINRDFTINSMAYRLPDYGLVDPLNGQEDMDKRIIREDHIESVFDDPLRVMRAVRFSEQLKFDIEKDTEIHIRESAPSIERIAPERIREELDKLLSKLDKPGKAMQRLHSLGVLERILPELSGCRGVMQEGGWHIYDVFDHTMTALDNSPKNLDLRLALLLHDIGKPALRRLEDERAFFTGHDGLSARMAKKVMERLRYSTKRIELVTNVIANHMANIPETDKGKRRLIRRVGEENVDLFIEHRLADLMGMDTERVKDEYDANVELGRQLCEIIEAKPPLSRRDMAIDGDDLKDELNLKEGRLLGEILDFLLEQVLDNPDINDRESLLKIARDFLNDRKKP